MFLKDACIGRQKEIIYFHAGGIDLGNINIRVRQKLPIMQLSVYRIEFCSRIRKLPQLPRVLFSSVLFPLLKELSAFFVCLPDIQSLQQIECLVAVGGFLQLLDRVVRAPLLSQGLAPQPVDFSFRYLIKLHQFPIRTVKAVQGKLIILLLKILHNQPSVQFAYFFSRVRQLFVLAYRLLKQAFFLCLFRVCLPVVQHSVRISGLFILFDRRFSVSLFHKDQSPLI